MGMTILFTMRTANRSPKHNYLRDTIRSLVLQGMAPEQIHVVPTDVEQPWIDPQIHRYPISLHWPERKRRPNENALAQIDLLNRYPANWIVMTEDDLEWCLNPLGSIEEWLTEHADESRLFYRFFSFGNMTQHSDDAWEAPLKEQKGSQVVAMRAEHARQFASWARTHPLNWRPRHAPFQDRPHDGFDKLLGYWALQANPKVTTGLVSKPFFVKHLGVESAIHSHGLRRDSFFGGADWSYRRSA